MPASGAAKRESPLPPPFAAVSPAAAHAVADESVARALGWAVASSTLHRIRRGEGALLAINLSLILQQGDALTVRGLMQAAVSILAILVMYAFNDLYDAPVDANNPKKDRALITTWLEHRQAGVLATLALKLVTLGLSLAALGATATAMVAAVMVVNIVYSTRLKGVPVADIAAVFVWGSLYAGIVSTSFSVLFLVGLMTGICHLFQALDDRTPDAQNGIETTAVRSTSLSRNVLVVLSIMLCASLYGGLGVAGAATAVVPLAIYWAVADAGVGWLVTKGYFAVVWLWFLGATGAAG